MEFCVMSEVQAYRVRDFCRAYGVSRSLAYVEMKGGRLRFFNVGRIRLISRDAAEGWKLHYEQLPRANP
jgi:hypothetical protein